MSYKTYLRELEISRVALHNKQAILAAGIYKDPFDGLNEAVQNYVNKLDYAIDEAVRNNRQTNQDLYEEWKQLFGKIDE